VLFLFCVVVVAAAANVGVLRLLSLLVVVSWRSITQNLLGAILAGWLSKKSAKGDQKCQ